MMPLMSHLKASDMQKVSTTPLRQCLPFSWTTLRGKHFRHSIAVMGVVDMFWQSQLKLNQKHILLGLIFEQISTPS